MRKASVLHKISILEAADDCFEGSFPRSLCSFGFFSTSERCKTGPATSKLTAILVYSKNCFPGPPRLKDETRRVPRTTTRSCAPVAARHMHFSDPADCEQPICCSKIRGKKISRARVTRERRKTTIVKLFDSS